MATGVVANTTATNAKVAAAIAPAKVAAEPGSLTRSGRTPIGASTRECSQMVRLAAAIVAAANIVGENHSDPRDPLAEAGAPKRFPPHGERSHGSRVQPSTGSGNLGTFRIGP